jgi:mono/diheme cytochrome c family protein
MTEWLIRGNKEEGQAGDQAWKHACPEMTDEEMANVLSYIRHSFGNKASVAKIQEVKLVRTAKK